MPSRALAGLGAVGAGLHIAGSVLIVVGQLLVRISHCIKESAAVATWGLPKSASSLGPRWRRPDGKWRRQLAGSKAYSAAGWGLFAAGNVARFVSMRFAAQTVLSGLGSLQFVVIPIASRWLLGIKTSGATWAGLAVVLLGNVLILLFGPPETAVSLRQLRYQWTTSAMQTFLVVLGSLLAGLKLAWSQFRRRPTARQQLTVAAAGAQAAAAAEGGGGTAALGEPATPLQLKAAPPAGSGAAAAAAADALARLGGALGIEGETLTMFSSALLFSAVSSFIGAWSVLFSKSLTYVVSGVPASLADWYSWLVLAAFLGTAAYWIRQSDLGLKKYPATLIMPLMQAFWMCMSVLQGGVYFGEFSALAGRDLALLLAGLLASLLGAISMGVSGYAYERPEQTLAYSLSPKGTITPDPEAAELLAGVSGRGLSAGEGAGVELALLADKLAAVASRRDGYASPTYLAARQAQADGFGPPPGEDLDAALRRAADDQGNGIAGGEPLERRLGSQGGCLVRAEGLADVVLSSATAPLGRVMQRTR